MRRATWLLALLLCLSACANQAADPLRQPLAASDEFALQRSLDALAGQLSNAQMRELRWALGVLMVTRTSPVERQQFLLEVIDGRTPQDLLAEARASGARFGID